MDNQLFNEIKKLINDDRENDAYNLLYDKKETLDKNEFLVYLNIFSTCRDRLIDTYVPKEERYKYIDYVSDYYKFSYISELSEEKQLEYKTLLNEIIKSEEADAIRGNMLARDSLSDEIIMSLIKYIDNNETRIGVLYHVSDRNKLKYIIENYKYPYNSEEIYSIIELIEDEKILNILLFSMKVLDKDNLKKYRDDHGINNAKFVRKHFLEFVELELDGDNNIQKSKDIAAEIIDDLTDYNLKDIDMNILSSKFIGKTHLDEILMFIQYNFTNKVTKLSDNEINVLLMCIEHYKSTTSNHNWNNYAGNLVVNLGNNQYSDLINSIKNIKELNLYQRELLYKILQNENVLGLNNINQLDNYEQIKEEKCKSLFTGDIESKKNAIFIKLFGIDLNYAKSLVFYFHDVDKFNNPFLKNYLQVLRSIINSSDEKLLEDLFKNQKVLNVDKTYIEDQIRQEYGKMFNQNLFIPSENNLISKEKNMYDAGTDFNMILSVIGVIEYHQTENYYEDWNRKTGEVDSCSGMFCASYIRSNCLGNVGGQIYVTFGFNSLNPSTMVGCHYGDGATHSNGFSSYTRKTYYTPDNLVMFTGAGMWKARYNEINYLRFNDGRRQQPDYLVGFKVNGIIANEKELLKAQKDFNGLPIVVIDVNRCIEKTKKEVLMKINEFNINPSSKLRDEIYYEIIRNRGICDQYNLDDFLPDIDLSSIKYKGNEPKTELIDIKDSLEGIKEYLEEERKEMGM